MTNKIFMTLTTLALAGALMLTALAQKKNDRPSDINPKNIPAVEGRSKKVMLPCKNSGSHQDVAKNMYVTNSSGKTIKKTSLVYYSATDGDKGSQYPDADVLAGKDFTVHGSPGQGYTCQAWAYVQ